MNNLKVNRPKLIQESGDIFDFEASEEQIKRYFSYFLDDAEIIEPKSLREWFKKKFKNALKNYSKE